MDGQEKLLDYIRLILAGKSHVNQSIKVDTKNIIF